MDVFDGVDNDALMIDDCNADPAGAPGSSPQFPHHWLGDGFCDDGCRDAGGAVRPCEAGEHAGDFNCDTYHCDDGDCGPPGSCRSVRGLRAFELTVDGGWEQGGLENMAEHEFFAFDARAGQTYWIATELLTLEVRRPARPASSPPSWLHGEALSVLVNGANGGTDATGHGDLSA